MTITKQEKGYLVDIRPSGRNGKRYRRTFSTKTEATKYEKFVLSQHHNREWLDTPTDRRPLTELVELWFQFHGKSLKDGEATREKLLASCKAMGDLKVYQVTKNQFSQYRAVRLEKVTSTTINLELKRLQGVFSALIKVNEFVGVHPLKGLPMAKTQIRELSFLRKEQIDHLLGLLTGDMLTIVKICLSTGARWSEAQNLSSSHVMCDRINFVNTKGGGNRTVPISDTLRQSIPNKSGALFSRCYNDFMIILKSSGIELPKGQASHVLRHTFASFFVMNGGNILTLQKILGHVNIQMTMRYAHLAPEHLFEAVRLNPLSPSSRSTF
ncbi:tyrosine-type recombinase/integrase [Shewanella sp. D64]|uniref:phage integrase n=1 Tax=unclassified Shewanella TaxID=196818 RepID=UPI0022BA47F5|nr:MULTISPECIES: tyrosine-type recombinase/integrase [unclassified Shewanella]MEC4725659.1 tyrosine-type recombinase/integrase [Shewanella sp. D64]MEC4737734.1 tyrosine-type recombinase/integrase [Shewanella sp. E94]WBJ93537.1 tyrosine-type recombinase/integrase [Shewanella sp. MTB7]